MKKKILLLLTMVALAPTLLSAIRIPISPYDKGAPSARGAGRFSQEFPDTFTVGDLRRQLADQLHVSLNEVLVRAANYDPDWREFLGTYFFNIDNPGQFDHQLLRDFIMVHHMPVQQILYAYKPHYLEGIVYKLQEKIDHLEALKNQVVDALGGPLVKAAPGGSRPGAAAVDDRIRR